MAKKKKNKSKKHIPHNFSPAKLNKELMPIANEIESKMKLLQSMFNFNLEEFAFPEITMEEIIKNPEN